MMKKIVFGSLPSISVFLFALLFAQPISAHGGEPRLEIAVERLNPGSVLEIRGVDFEFEEEITLALIGPQVEIPLGTMMGDAEGIFLLTVTLPADLTEGIYIIRATTDDHVLNSPQITVWGTAAIEDGEEGQREEEDGLLAPVPTFAPVASAPAEITPSPTWNQNILTLVALIMIGIVAILGLKRKKME